MDNMFILLTAANKTASTSGSSFMWIMLILMFILIYFMMIGPQKKKEKADKAMRDNLQIGDEVVTIGGVIGRVITIKDDSIIIETGADRTKIRFSRTAISTNLTAAEKANAERQASIDAKKAQTEVKKNKKDEDKKEDKKVEDKKDDIKEDKIDDKKDNDKKN